MKPRSRHQNTNFILEIGKINPYLENFESRINFLELAGFEHFIKFSLGWDRGTKIQILLLKWAKMILLEKLDKYQYHSEGWLGR